MADNKNIEAVVNIIKEEFTDAVIEVIPAKDTSVIKLKKEALISFCRFLHDDSRLNFNYLSFLTALDYPEKENRFEVVYQLYSIELGHNIRIKVPLSEQDAEIDSVICVWESANLLEREVFDMFGIVFKNHPDLRRIYLPEDWEGHPLRKNFPIRGF